MKLKDVVIQRLSSTPGEKLRARQLAEWILETYPAACHKKIEHSKFLTNEKELLSQLVAEIGANRPAWESKHSELKSTAERPRRYYWTELSDEAAAAAADEGPGLSTAGVPQLSEASLYPLVVQFLKTEFGIYSMRVDEKTAANKKGSGGNKWLFPDICGLQDLVSSLHRDVRALVDLVGDKKALLWSFEVKVVLNHSNVREAFFQAVSNSSWANYGYLVAAQVDDKVMGELRMMHGLHGIGLIQLNPSDPTESQMLIPATLRDSVDWLAFNRLATECGDFRKFAKLVRNFHLTNEATPAAWE